MYRRIEIIHDETYKSFFDGNAHHYRHKSGLMTYVDESVIKLWVDKLTGPTAPKNCRFYFTEQGWKEVGRKVVEQLQKVKQKYRVIKIKEKSVDVIAKGPFEVAIRPRKKND